MRVHFSGAGGCFDPHGARDRRGPGQRTVCGNETVNLCHHVWREGRYASGSQVSVRMHAFEERGKHATRLVYHEHHVMEKLRVPREEAWSDHHAFPDAHFGWIPQVLLEIEAARSRRCEVVRSEPEHRIHRVPRLIVEGQVPANVHVPVPVLVNGRDRRPINRRQRRELIE